MTKRVLITGAGGFVGGHLIEYLLADGQAVLGCDLCKPSALLALPAEAHDGIDWLQWDLADPEGLSRDVQACIERFAPEVIYHLAALSIPADCGGSEPTEKAVAVNVEGTRRVLALATTLSTKPRVLVVSSSHVYAPVSHEVPVVSETWPTQPTSGYGKTKLAAERIALEIAQRDGIDVVITRAFQHTGPRQGPRMMLAEWASQLAAASSEPIKVHTLDAQVDVTDVRDVVRAYRLLAEHGTSGEIYNIGSGISRRSGELFEMLRQTAGSTRPVVELRPGTKQDPIADISKLTTNTGWRPEIPIEQTIADTWSYWQKKIGR